MIDLNEVGALASADAAGNFSIRFGVYLPGVRYLDGFDVVVRLIHQADRFDPAVPTTDFHLNWVDGSPLDLWTTTLPIQPAAGHFGQEGTYLYRYQLWWTPAGGTRQLITRWFTDPFARATEIGLLSAVDLIRSPQPFTWTDATYETPELQDLIVYELQVQEFGDNFDGVAAQIPYLESLGVNCLELMPVSSAKVDFDWGYGPLHYFAPSKHFGGPAALKRLVDACHTSGMAVILDVVYQHVDPLFAYQQVYSDIQSATGRAIQSPMIGSYGPFGPQADFSKQFTQEYFFQANQHWLDEYHVDGFRYDEVTDLYQGPTDSAYAKLSYEVYLYSLGIARFQRDPASYSRIIQCAEALSIARQVLSNTYTSCAWQDDLLNKSEDMMIWNYVDANFAHILDVSFSGYPVTKTVVNAAGQPVDMPVTPFQYLESHDHSQLIVFAGTADASEFSPGDRSLYYRLQPFAIALYTAQGIPMLWQGQEAAGDYHLPSSGEARIQLRRDMHWENFYDEYGSALIRLYRILGRLRRTYRCLRSRDSYFYYQQSLQNGSGILAYHRHAAAQAVNSEEYAFVFLNFSSTSGEISVPFPKAGLWREFIDDDQRHLSVQVPTDGQNQLVSVPSNYGQVFVWQG